MTQAALSMQSVRFCCRQPARCELMLHFLSVMEPLRRMSHPLLPQVRFADDPCLHMLSRCPLPLERTCSALSTSHRSLQQVGLQVHFAVRRMCHALLL